MLIIGAQAPCGKRAGATMVAGMILVYRLCMARRPPKPRNARVGTGAVARDSFCADYN
jgi:hypothetical protein